MDRSTGSLSAVFLWTVKTHSYGWVPNKAYNNTCKNFMNKYSVLCIM